METRQAHAQQADGVRRRDLLKAGLAAGADAVCLGPCIAPLRSGVQKRGSPSAAASCACVAYDPPHFDPHLTLNVRTNTTLSFVYSKLVRYKVGADVRPGTFIVEPHLAERWEQPDDTTYIFHLRQGVKWHNKPPLNGRELVAEDVKFTYDRFLTERESTALYAGVRRPHRGGGPLYGEVPPQRALRLAGQCAGQPVQHVDHRPRSGAAVRRPEESRRAPSAPVPSSWSATSRM